MLPTWFILIAIALRLFGNVHYIRAVIRRKAHPNPVTWFFWALTSLIVFAAQIMENVGWSAAATLSLAVGPLIIFALSLKNDASRAQFNLSSIACGLFAAIGIILWLNEKDPIIAIIFSIAADAFASLPTVIKAWRQPNSEYLPAYAFSMSSMVIALLTLTDWNFASYAFPAYIFTINLIIISTGGLKKHLLHKRRRK